jgi:DNA-binding MarR family transcriptional regulator
MPFKMTKNRHVVLTKLAEAKEAMFSRDFADVATIVHGRWEWAAPILRQLEEAGYTRRSGVKTYKGQAFEITDAGRAALDQKPAEVKRTGKLTMAMENHLIFTAKRQEQGWPYETCCNRSTLEALEARDLVTIERRPGSWQHVRLTEAGRVKASALMGHDVVIAPQRDCD